MMEYRAVKNAMRDMLGDQAEGRFKVIGFQRQTKSADEFTGDNKTVQVYYSEGNFDKKRGAMRGHKLHDITLNIDMSASAPAEADLTVLDSPTSTPEQKAAALLAVREAAEVADDLIDELIEAVFAIIEDARNEDLGLEEGRIASRWLESIKKDANLERGDLVMKTANIRYTCRVEETVLGDIGNEPAIVTIDSSSQVDDTDGAGAIIKNDNT